MAQLVFKDPNIRISQPKSLVTYLPVEMRPYQFKKTRTPRLDTAVARPGPAPEEVLFGNIRGVRASALEERFAAALDFYGIPYRFQFEVPSAYSLPGEEKVIDFVVFDAGLGIAIEIGSRFVHATPSEQERDKQREAVINPILALQGIQPIMWIPFDRPNSLEDAKELVSQLFISA